VSIFPVTAAKLVAQNDGLAMLRGYVVEFNSHHPEQLIFGSNGRGFFEMRWPKNLLPVGNRRYAHTADDTRFAAVQQNKPIAQTLSSTRMDTSAAGEQITNVLRDFGGASLDYVYGADWKLGQNITAREEGGIGFVQLDTTENGGAGMVLNGVHLAPQKQTHLALRARKMAGNTATQMNVNLNRAEADGGGKTVSLDLSKLKENEWSTITVALPAGNWSHVQQIQFQGTNWSAGAQPLKIQIDKFGTMSLDPAANAALNTAASNPTSGPAPKDKPSVAGWGFWGDFPQAWQATHKGFLDRTKQGREKKDINVVFFGDSITQGWGDAGKAVWEKNYAPLGAVNYGIGGDTTRQVLWRIQNGEIEGLNPKLVVLKIGTNNLYDDNNSGSDEEIAEGIKTIVKTLRQKLPKTKILLLGILPRQNEWFSNRAKNINAIIAKLDDGKAVRYFDMSAKFQTEVGKVVPQLYTDDQLHLATPGYQMWAETMQPLFSQMMK
jgi:lysophospholipase L1-like esterase